MATPIETYSTAKGYVQSAFAMMANPLRYQLPDDTTFMLSFHMLMGFAVELYLKAFLSHHGVDEKTLRGSKVRHSLNTLYQMAVSHGLSDNGALSLSALLHEHHESFGYRYMDGSKKYTLRPLVEIFDHVSSLDRAVDAAVGASASTGKAIGSGWSFPQDGTAWRVI